MDNLLSPKNPFWKNHVWFSYFEMYVRHGWLQTIKYFGGGWKSYLIDMTSRSSFLHKSPLSPRDTLWMFVLNVAEGKWLCAPHAPLKFDKLLFPCFANGNYVSSLSSTTKVSSWTETFCLESFLTVRRKWLTLYSLYSSKLLTLGMLHCHCIHSGDHWCHWLICHAD